MFIAHQTQQAPVKVDYAGPRSHMLSYIMAKYNEMKGLCSSCSLYVLNCFPFVFYTDIIRLGKIVQRLRFQLQQVWLGTMSYYSRPLQRRNKFRLQQTSIPSWRSSWLVCIFALFVIQRLYVVVTQSGRVALGQHSASQNTARLHGHAADLILANLSLSGYSCYSQCENRQLVQPCALSRADDRSLGRESNGSANLDVSHGLQI